MFGRFNRVQLEEDIGNWTVYRLMNINEAGNGYWHHRRLGNSIQRGKSYGVGVEIQTVTTRPGRKYRMRKALAPPPPRPPPPSSCPPPPKKTRPHWLKSNYFYSEIHCKWKRDLFCRKLRHSEIKSSRLRDRKKRTITGQSCRISKIYRDLDNSLRLFSANENKRGMAEGPHPVDYRLGGAILLLILD